ncbi:MAG TPA: Uma2 family endonuclease [Thermoanaerobaculia bacterium]|nr:Uma2 family endonuclease [Thermoanaerobaculia bacterium]
MTQIAIRDASIPFNVELGSALRLSDDELFELCGRNPELRIERTPEGDLIVMTPAGGESSHRNARLVTAIMGWADRDGTGVAFDATAGFLLPNGAMRSPDAAWVERSRWRALEPEQRRGFVPLAPDFVLELRSPSDRLPDLRAKMEEYRACGVRLGWLIDPEERRVHVYRPDRVPEVLEAPPRVAADPELPGFVLDLKSIWAPA